MLACQNEPSDCNACAPRSVCRHTSHPCTATRALGNSSGHCVCQTLIFNIFISRVAKYYYTKRYALIRNMLSHGNFDHAMRKCQFIQAPHVEEDTSRPISLCTTVGHHTHNLDYINVGTFSKEANRPGHAYKNIDMQTCVQTLRT